MKLADVIINSTNLFLQKNTSKSLLVWKILKINLICIWEIYTTSAMIYLEQSEIGFVHMHTDLTMRQFA
jgi:hypothetical protein